MNYHEKGYEIIKGEGRADLSQVEIVLRKLLKAENLKPTKFLKDSGSVTAAHYHTEDLAAYVLKGKIQIKTGEDHSNIMEFLPGDAFKMKKGTIHREEVISDEPCEMTGAYMNDYLTVQVDM